ncbi:MAG: K+-dependent Na+/Ca+ exchanger [Cyclobacteriaceae bacterium]|nr:MAG: K+-dependent Na+/Ca+ exchanger [Cyclobacteriaceae bacterium]
MLLTITLLLAGFAVLIKGADFLVSGASSVARKMGISSLAIGLTVVAFGTSAPELVVSLIAAIDGKADASFGNVIGSNNFNLMFILGVCGIIYPLTVQRNTVKYEVPLSILAAIGLFVLANDSIIWKHTRNVLSRTDAVILLLFFTGFLMYIYRTMKNETTYEETPINLYSTPVSVLRTAGGLAMLVAGGKLVVDNAVAIASHFGLSERIIGLTILAAGTSLPELATSAVAAYKKNTDIAIGNVVGSNIFNIFFILGLTGIIQPMHYNASMNLDLYILVISTLVLMIFMFTIKRRRLDRWEAVILLVAYLVYTIYQIGADQVPSANNL